MRWCIFINQHFAFFLSVYILVLQLSCQELINKLNTYGGGVACFRLRSLLRNVA